MPVCELECGQQCEARSLHTSRCSSLSTTPFQELVFHNMSQEGRWAGSGSKPLDTKQAPLRVGRHNAVPI